jgi:hypothetical protein
VTGLDTSLSDVQAALKPALAEAKPILQSRTIWALIVTVAAYAANKLGAHVGGAQVNQIVDLVTTVVQGGGITAAALFRVTAKGPLK